MSDTPPEPAPAPSRMLRIARAASRARADLLMGLLDAVLVAGGYFGVLLVRVEGDIAPWVDALPVFLVLALVVHLLGNWAWGLYGHMWRHAGVQEARRVLLAGGTALVLLAVLALALPSARLVPLTVLFLGPVVTTGLSGMLRFQSRLFAFNRSGDPSRAIKVLVVGAGESGAAIIRDMLRRRPCDLRPVALLDDDPRTHGRRIHGIPVRGGIRDLPEVAAECTPDQALLAIPSASRGLVRKVANLADSSGLPLKVLPPVEDIVGGTATVRDVRDLSIDDLLGRGQVHTDLDAVRRLLAGKRVLITGAGGSIGSEIARQVADCDPAELVLLDHDETHLFDASMSIRRPGAQADHLVEVLADVRDAELMDHYMARHKPQIVFHAAAHKHVPILETHACEAIATNIVGTANVVGAAARHGVERFVFVSTDKAVQPKSVMGASKRLGEQLVLASAPAGTSYCAVRFGNVLGSRGSVVPLFTRQIRAGGPVTVTDKDMTRFFMSIPEAVQLVLQAAALSEGNEVFMLDMGEPVRIYDLAQRMIRLSGRRVGTDIEIRITGARSGEKLEEELRAPDEAPYPTAHPAIVALYPSWLDSTELADGIGELTALARHRDNAGAAAALRALAARQGTVLRLPDSSITLADTGS